MLIILLIFHGYTLAERNQTNQKQGVNLATTLTPTIPSTTCTRILPYQIDPTLLIGPIIFHIKSHPSKCCCCISRLSLNEMSNVIG